MKKVSIFFKRYISYICAVLSWGLMLLIFWYFENKAYGGNLEVGFIYMLINPPVIVLFSFIFKKDREGELEQQSTSKPMISNRITDIILTCLGLVFLWLIVFKTPYQITIYYFLSLLFFYTIITYILPKKAVEKINIIRNSVWSISIIFWILIVDLLLFCVIANPITVKEGQQLIAENGYENVQYMKSMNTPLLDFIFDDCSPALSKHEDALNFYLYRGIKNGESYGIAVSLAGRRIVAETKDENNSNLLDFYEFHHN